MNHTAKSKKLHLLGLSLFGKAANLSARQLRTDYDVRIQNRNTSKTFGDCMTVNPNSKGTVECITDTNRLIFVDYDDVRYVRIYECTNKSKYDMEYVGGENREGLKRVSVCYRIADMKLLHEIDNPDLLLEMQSLSSARKYQKL